MHKRALVALVAVAMLSFFTVIGWQVVWDSLGDLLAINPWAVASAVVLNALSSVSRGVAWGLIVRGAVAEPPRLGWSVSAFLAGQLGNLVAPARLGEAAKLALITSRCGGEHAAVPLAGSILAHRLLDVVPVTLMVAVAVLTTGLPGSLPVQVAIAVGVVVVIVSTGVLLARTARRAGPASRWARAVNDARAGFGALGDARTVAVTLVLQSVGWLLAILGAWALLVGAGIDVGPAEALLVILATSVATVFTFWPGNVGIVQAAIAAALVPAGVPPQAAVTFGIALQAAEALAAAGPGGAALAVEATAAGRAGRRMSLPTRRR
jgi:uncharacterized protein (TIRG00374 family)